MEESKFPKLITKLEYARHRGIAPSQISKAIKIGKITTVFVNGKEFIDPVKADSDWEENSKPEFDTEEKNSTGKSNDNIPSYAESRRYREALNFSIAQLEFNERSGKLVRVEDVRTGVFNVCRTIRDSFLQLPDRVAAQITSMIKINPDGTFDPNEMHVLLTKEINKILESLVETNKW